MIQNLNQVSFQGFGTILPERDQNPESVIIRDALQTLHPVTGESAVYQAEQNVWLCPASGTTVLSVSLDNTVFRDYYLDKPVWVTAGVYFGLTALHGSSSVPQEFVKMVNQYGGAMPDAIGIPEEMLRQAAKMAVCKINIDSDLRLAMTAAIREHFAQSPEHFDPRQYLSPARANIKSLVKHKLVNVLGCNNKA